MIFKFKINIIIIYPFTLDSEEPIINHSIMLHNHIMTLFDIFELQRSIPYQFKLSIVFIFNILEY